MRASLEVRPVCVLALEGLEGEGEGAVCLCMHAREIDDFHGVSPGN